MLQQFNAGQCRYGLIEGSEGYIVTETDFCHEALPLNKPVVLDTVRNEQYQVFTLEEIRLLASPVTSFREWAHYWGIKDRIERNYRLLLNSMRDIGADVSQMPAWGEEVEPTRRRL